LFSRWLFGRSARKATAVTHKEFQSLVRSRKIPPVTLFHGSEDLLIEHSVDQIIAQTLSDGTKGFNLDTLYGSKVSVQEVVAIASAFPMMSERRIVIVKEFEKLATTEAAKEIFAAYLTRPLESTLLILIAGEVDFRRKPFTDLKKHATVVECKALYDNEIPDWIVEGVKKSGRTIDPDAVMLLQEQVGNSLRALANEIEKIIIYLGEEKSVTLDHVSAVVGASKGYTIFDLQNAIGAKNLARAMSILAAMLQHGQSPQTIIIMLTRFFVQLWKLSDPGVHRLAPADLAKEVKVHPYFLRSLQQFQSNYTQKHLESNFRVLLQADKLLKTTSREPHIVLDLLVYSLIRGTPESELALS